jgi:thermosome
MTDDIVSQENERMVGKTAQRNNILAAKILAETIKTTLGPKGMDKMLVDTAGNITITNDGVTILNEMDIDHPAAKMLVEVSKTQEKEVGDGTTTVVMIAGKLLENAEDLLDKKIHPTIIVKGYIMAQKKSMEILNNITHEINDESELSKVAQTAMTGKGAEYMKEKFSEIILEAVKIISDGNNFDVSNIRIEKQQGDSIEQSELVKGIVLNIGKSSMEMPNIVKGAKIALIEESLEIKSPETEAKISVASPEQLQSFISHEDNILRNKVDKIKSAGANVVICQRGIDEVVQFYFGRAGIYTVRRVAKSDMQAIAKATGAKIISKLSEISKDDLGNSERVENITKDGEDMTYITGCLNPKSLTILIRGGSEHAIDETERAIEDALGDISSLLKDSKIVAGGGAVEMEVSKQLKEYSKTLTGREQLAVEKFAEALEFIPVTLAENAGLDTINILTELKIAHESGENDAGLNLFTGKVENTYKAGIIEPLKVKTQAIKSATEVATMILRIDDVIAAKQKSHILKNPSAMLDYE